MHSVDDLIWIFYAIHAGAFVYFLWSYPRSKPGGQARKICLAGIVLGIVALFLDFTHFKGGNDAVQAASRHRRPVTTRARERRE